MEYDFSKVVGHGLPDFGSVMAALLCQVDLNDLSDADRFRIETVAPDGDRFAAIRCLLSAGADPGKFGWTEIFLALAFGTMDDLEEALTGKSDIEAMDAQWRTAFLFAVQLGDVRKAEFLIEAGANILAIGHMGATALDYAIKQDNVPMLEWLFEQGFNANSENADGETAAYVAAGSGAVNCLRKLIESGADVRSSGTSGSYPIVAASDRQVIGMLLDAGADLQMLEPEQLARLLGYGFDQPPECSLEDYEQYSSRAFGRSNPERVFNPFWTAMVRCGGSAARAEGKFSTQQRLLSKGKKTDASKHTQKKTWSDSRTAASKEPQFRGGYPIWSYQRFGKTITRLPDGRFIEIAGEHEDFYDPNFCIYNDVIVHDGQGGCEIYTYPTDVFPPTDFHSATLVSDFIYIIGNLGYGEYRRSGYTPVYRLNIQSYKVERVETGGEMPGWIHRHNAWRDSEGRIVIADGRCSVAENGQQELIFNSSVFALDLKTLKWTRMS